MNNNTYVDVGLNLALTIVIVVASICVLVALFLLITTNVLRRKEEEIKKKTANLEVSINTKQVVLSEHNSLFNEYLSHEEQVLHDVFDKRYESAKSTKSDKNVDTTALTKGLNAIVESNPDLKSGAICQSLGAQCSSSEELVLKNVNELNSCICKYNKCILTFPFSIIAKLMHFKSVEYISKDNFNNNSYYFKK